MPLSGSKKPRWPVTAAGHRIGHLTVTVRSQPRVRVTSKVDSRFRVLSITQLTTFRSLVSGSPRHKHLHYSIHGQLFYYSIQANILFIFHSGASSLLHHPWFLKIIFKSHCIIPSRQIFVLMHPRKLFLLFHPGNQLYYSIKEQNSIPFRDIFYYSVQGNISVLFHLHWSIQGNIFVILSGLGRTESRRAILLGTNMIISNTKLIYSVQSNSQTNPASFSRKVFLLLLLLWFLLICSIHWSKPVLRELAAFSGCIKETRTYVKLRKQNAISKCIK